MKLHDLDKGQKFIWEWQFRRLGHFDTALAEVLSISDGRNRDKFRKSFPEYANAMDSFQSDTGWWDRVQDIMDGAI